MARTAPEMPLPPGVRLIRMMKSKKNGVALVDANGERLVLKVYSEECRGCQQDEVRILEAARRRGVSVPEVVSVEEGRIWMIPHGAETMYDVAASEAGEAEKRLEMARCSRWLRSFHEAFAEEGTIHGDATMGNFLMGPQVVGVDFEESRKGSPEEDAGMLVAHALACFGDRPLLALALSQGVLEGYGHGRLDERKMNESTVSGLELLAKHREDGCRLRKMAEMMRKDES